MLASKLVFPPLWTNGESVSVVPCRSPEEAWKLLQTASISISDNIAEKEKAMRFISSINADDNLANPDRKVVLIDLQKLGFINPVQNPIVEYQRLIDVSKSEEMSRCSIETAVPSMVQFALEVMSLKIALFVPITSRVGQFKGAFFLENINGHLVLRVKEFRSDKFVLRHPKLVLFEIDPQ